MPSSVICYDCGKPITDRVYSVQRRRIRPTEVTLPDGTIKYNPQDAVDRSHAGVILGPEYDPYCPTCYTKLPTIQELINAHKEKLDSDSKNLD